MTLFQFYVCSYVFVTVLCYSDEFSDGYHYSRAFPQEVMVDVINNFGLSLLEAHNEGNENNIALSPYGATSVLVALGEGIQGYAMREIQKTTRIPLDISVIRVGLRDIHRHLKSYFIPKEGFLAGLTLSNEKVPLIPRYEEILRFYGYDLESFNNPLYPNEYESAPAVYTNVTTMTMTITTPGLNETTVQNSDMVTTTEILIPDRVESRFENTEMFEITTAKTMNYNRTTVSPTYESTIPYTPIASALVDTTKTTSSNIDTPMTTLQEVVSTTLKQRTFPKPTTLSNILPSTENFPSTSKQPLIRESNTNTDNSGSNSNIEEITIGISTEPPSTVATNSDISEAIVGFTTTERQEYLSTSGTTITTYQNAEFNYDSSLTLETTTFKSDLALEVSDMIQNGIFTTIALPESTFSTGNSKAAILETSTKSEISVNPTTLLMDDTLISTTLKTTSKLMQNDGITTPPEISSTSFASSDPIITTESNIVVSTKNSKLADIELDYSSEETVEGINNDESTPNQVGTFSGDIMGSTTVAHTISIVSTTYKPNISTVDEINNDELTPTQMGTFSSDNMGSTTVANTISKVSTTYETSFSTTTDITETDATSIIPNNFTSFNVEGTTDATNEDISSERTDIENSTDITTITNNFTAMSMDNLENSTEVPENESMKREARSIIDYVIARYYDNIPRREYYERTYTPDEKLSFLVYGRVKETNINFMTYDAVLPIAYIPVIDALALSFPLDSKEYYLLLLLPIDETGINKLIYDIKQRTSLRNIINSLRYAHVRAIIPSFMLKGYVILTPTLQKLGIRRIFEPRHTDFSLMTKERDIYVTNIEQAVTVKIRNYVDPDNLPNYQNLQQYQPTEFKADHPFLYFVMDSDIHVNLMAGKIVNPLNSRVR